MLLKVIARTGFLLFLFTLCISLSALLSSWYVTRQISIAIKAKTSDAAQQDPFAGEPTSAIDFYAATGIGRKELQEFLRDFTRREQADNYPALVTLQNSRGDYLAESRVIVRWNTGEQRLLVGSSGVVRFLLNERILEGLKVIAPAGFHILRQRSIPLGNAYDPQENLDTSELPFQVYDDGYVQTTITRELARLQSEGNFIRFDEFQEQLHRSDCALKLPPPGDTALTAEEIYQRKRDSVVIIAHLYPDGRTTQAAGFMLDSSGVIATNYHVVDKPTAIARGVMTSASRMYPVRQVLAGEKSADVALLKIDATNLQAAPLADGAAEGAAVTLISHPNSRYYSLTQGYISRYFATVSYGRLSLRMGVTAEFAAGSSGAPLFDTYGNVAGIVSATENESYQMVHRSAIPSHTIRKLIRLSDDGPS